MSGTLKIVHVVLSMDLGGLERIVLDLLTYGRQLGQQADLICLERPGTLAPQVQAQGIALQCAHKRPGIRLSTIRQMRAILAQVQPDLVHTHQIAALFYAGPAARRMGIPVVHTEHGKHYAARFRTRLLGRLAGRYASRFFCVSQDIAAEVAAHRIVPPEKIEIVRNGIDTGLFQQPGDVQALRQSLRIPGDAPVIGTMGRLSEVKRQDLLIRAFARVRAQLPHAHLLLVGDGPLMAELRRLVSGLGLDACVHFTGYQPRPQQYLHAMDLFALTSRSEGMPLVILEAWAAGVPVVASEVGGLPELIRHRQTGLLFPPGDEQALASAICDVLADRSKAMAMASAGLACVESSYHVRTMAENYHRRYLELAPQSADSCAAAEQVQ